MVWSETTCLSSSIWGNMPQQLSQAVHTHTHTSKCNLIFNKTHALATSSACRCQLWSCSTCAYTSVCMMHSAWSLWCSKIWIYTWYAQLCRASTHWLTLNSGRSRVWWRHETRLIFLGASLCVLCLSETTCLSLVCLVSIWGYMSQSSVSCVYLRLHVSV